MATTPPPQPAPPAQPPTPGQNARRFLLYGFAISVGLHLLIGPFIHAQPTPPEDQQADQVKVERLPTPVPVTPTPKPTPTPAPTPTPRATPTPPPQKITPPPQPQPVKKLKVDTLKTHHTGGESEAANTHRTGSDTGNPTGTSDKGTSAPAPGPTGPPASPAPTPTPTPIPTPTPSPPPSCANPNVPPTTVNPATPETPEIARQQGITGEVQVEVSLDENSHITGTTVRSGPAVLRQAAIAATKQSTFKTEIKNCKPLPATYIFVVDFQSQ